MGATLAERLPAARELYDRANEILGFDLARLCFEGPAEELDSTVIQSAGAVRHQPGRGRSRCGPNRPRWCYRAKRPPA